MLSADLMSGQWRNIPTDSGEHETNQICTKHQTPVLGRTAVIYLDTSVLTEKNCPCGDSKIVLEKKNLL